MKPTVGNLLPATPIEVVGLGPGALARVRRAGISSLEGLAEVTDRELVARGLWVGDIRRIVAALSDRGLTLPYGTRGGPPRRSAPGARPVRQDGAHVLGIEQRDRQIVAARVRGDSLREIGQRFGISRERVRQVLMGTVAENSGEARSARSRREQARAAARRDDVLSAFREGLQPRAIARAVGLPGTVVTSLVAEHATTEDRLARRRAQGAAARREQHGYTEEELVRAVAEVVETLGRVPSSAEYGEIARASDLPSIATIEARLGWNAAVRAAGFRPGRRARDYRRRWTEEACLEALRALVAELGSLPSRHNYDVLSRTRPDLPSSSTVRVRAGSWSALHDRVEGGAERRWTDAPST